MTLADLGNLGEFIASIGVLITLIYLAIQIRQNTAATRIQIRQAISEAQFANINSRATDEHLPLIIMKVNRGEPINTEEHDRLYFHLDATMRQFENFHSHHTAGMLSDMDWKAIRAGMIRTLRTELAQEIWAGIRHAYNEDFQTVVDTAIRSDKNDE